MRIQELFEFKKEKEDNEDKIGTYAAVKLSQESKDKLRNFVKENKIPNPLPADDYHTTLLYSPKHLPTYEPLGKLEEPIIATPLKLEKWPSSPDEDGHVSMCLVLKVDCPDLIERHKFLMDEYDAEYTHPTYNPHITLSYDIGSLQVKSISNIKEHVEKIEYVEEYSEDLNLNWAKEKSKK